MNCTVLGCGRWGSFLACFHSRRFPVTLWGRAGSRSFETLRQTRKNDSLTLPDEVQAHLDKGSSMRVLGDMAGYTRFQAAEAIEQAAGNDGVRHHKQRRACKHRPGLGRGRVPGGGNAGRAGDGAAKRGGGRRWALTRRWQR